MIKISKRLLSIVLAFSIIAGYSVCAMATTASKSVEGYGTLKGILSDTSSTSVAYLVKTSITQNTDNAWLVTELELCTSGGNLYSELSYTTDRGATNWSKTIYFSSIEENAAYRIYGSHEVRGGTTYDAAVVYTSASI